MKKPLRVKYKLAFCGSMVALLMADASNIALSDDGPANNFSTNDIFKKAQETYDSLTSYSDKGKSVITYKGVFDHDETFITTFTIKLARPNLYRIEWETVRVLPQVGTKTGKKAVWSAGKDAFWDIGSGPERQKEQDRALMTQTGSSGDATETMPGVFFKMHWGNQFGDLGLNEKREVDEKVGDINCYVFSKESNGVKRTLWIGKQDFLIRQVRNVSVDKALESDDVPLPKSEPTITTIETHSDILVNQKLLPVDFTH